LDVSADPDYVPFVPDMRAQMTLPLLSHQRFICILSLETAHPDRFGTEIFDFVKLLATRTAIAIDNANAYEEQTKLVEELDAFALTVAHDLKDPLGIILGYVWVLVDDLEQLPTDEVQDFLEMIADSSQKMDNIISELLLLARVRKLDEVETSPLDMDHVVKEALSRLTLMIEENEAEIIMPDSWPVASGYAGWVEEVWANYISNAIKYGGTPPVVEVGATLLDDGMVRCWVRDNGPGLEPEQQARLFNSFTQLDQTRAHGHGLGLSIVQRIVDKLGGQLGVESEVGAGSVFSFTLPTPD
jgi:signal transduction histidine kinase